MSGPEMEAHKKSKMAERKTVNPNRVTPEQIERAKRQIRGRSISSMA